MFKVRTSRCLNGQTFGQTNFETKIAGHTKNPATLNSKQFSSSQYILVNKLFLVRPPKVFPIWSFTAYNCFLITLYIPYGVIPKAGTKIGVDLVFGRD